ncbi:MAG: hypothetical protein ACOC8H_01965 [bacterium]
MCVQSPASSQQARPGLGLVWILTYVALSIGPVVVAPDFQTRLEFLEEQYGPAPDEARAVITAQAARDWLPLLLNQSLLFLPVLLRGLRHVSGPNHRLWAWQQERRRRHPFLAFIPYVLFVGGVRIFATRVYVLSAIPDGHALGDRSMDLYGAPIMAAVGLALAAWLYVGRRAENASDGSAAAQENASVPAFHMPAVD